MRFKLVSERSSAPPSCTFDHVYVLPQKKEFWKGTSCVCGERRFGIEPKQREIMQLDDDGHVKRLVARRISMQRPTKAKPTWTYVFTLQGCGHVAVKTSDDAIIWNRVRCRNCERDYKSMATRMVRVDEKKAKRAERKKRLEEKLRWREQQRKVLRVRLPRKRRRFVLAASAAVRGTGVIRIRISKTRSNGRKTRG